MKRWFSYQGFFLVGIALLVFLLSNLDGTLLLYWACAAAGAALLILISSFASAAGTQEPHIFEGRFKQSADPQNVLNTKQLQASPQGQFRLKMISMVIHDLRTPMQTVMTFLEMLEDSELNNQDETLIEATFAIRKLNRLSAELLEKLRSKSMIGSEDHSPDLGLEVVEILSGELLAPVNTVGRYISSLRSKLHKLPPDEQAIFALAEQDIEYMHRLVKDLLDIEKLRSGDLMIDVKATDLSRAVNRSFSTVRALAKQKNISLVSEATSHLYADEFRLVQIITNILTNAIKYSAPNTKVVVSCTESDEFAFVSIADEGCGIPREHLGEIFLPFNRLSQTKHSNEGFGLGLAICKALVQLHKGSIKARREEGKGSTITFSIPLAGNKKNTNKFEIKNAATPLISAAQTTSPV